jgi:hypothetical protein
MGTYEHISSVDEMRDYVYTMLGWPVVNIEVSQDQVDQCVIDSIADFRRYNYDEGAYMDVIMFQCSAGVTDYYLSAGSIKDMATGESIDNIQEVYDFSVRDGLDGINTLFSPTHILLYNEYVNLGNYPGGPVDTGGAGMTLSNFQSSMMYLASVREMFGKMYRVKYMAGRNMLKVIPTPYTNVFGALVIYRKEYMDFLYNNQLVKKLSLARVKKLWGRSIGKTTGTLPDGLTINYDMIYNEGKEEETEALTWIRTESAPCDFMVG